MSMLRPMDPTFPIERQLAVDASPVVLVNIFTIDKADEHAFLKAWQDDAAFMKRRPGFISTQLHRAIGESPCYLNYGVSVVRRSYAALVPKSRRDGRLRRLVPRNAMQSVNPPREGRRVPLALELATVIGLALMAGFLFNMSVVTAPALNALSPASALAAWKGINSTVRNPLFSGTAFGTAVLVVACAAVAWRSRLKVYCLSFALLYLIGVIGTTFAVENAVNTAIIAATQPPPELSRMLSTWLAGNHVRAVSAVAAFVVAWVGFRLSD